MGRPRDLLSPTPRGWVGGEKAIPKIASPTMVPYSGPMEPQRINQLAAECPRKKLANHLTSLGLSLLLTIPVLHRAVAGSTKRGFSSLSDT